MAKHTRAKKKEKDSEKGITGITVCGFKSLAQECSIEIRPLTILAGANGSGKSSIMQPLLLLKQTLEASYDPGSLLLDGPNVAFTSSEQFLSRLHQAPSTKNFTIGVVLKNTQTLLERFTIEERKGIQIAEMICEVQNCTVSLRPKMREKELKSMNLPDLCSLNWSIASEMVSSGRLPGPEPLEDRVKLSVKRARCFLYVGLDMPNEKLSFPFYEPAEPFGTSILKMIHVPGLRGNPERTYKRTAVGPEFPGTFENYIAAVISHWKNEKDQRLKGLGTELKKLGLTWKVDAMELDATRVELRVARLKPGVRGGAKDMVNIADVGFGVSQVLPVLVALLTAEPSQLVYLEQPELHLHPKAQVALAQVLAEAANRGVRVVAETHSALLLLAIQTLVAEGDISTDKVILHWFKRRDDGVTEVTSADLDDAGAFGEDWPEDFGDVELEAESDYLKAAESRLMKR